MTPYYEDDAEVSALADKCIESVDVECTRWNACTDCWTGT